MKIFPAILLGVFILLGGITVVIFATFTGGGGKSNLGDVVMWGSLSESDMNDQLIALGLSGSSAVADVAYTEISSETFASELVNAIASNTGPDLVLLSTGNMFKEGEKLSTLPYSNTTMSRREFQNAFIEASEVLLLSDGFKGFPYFADPLVLYWNRTLFTNAGLTAPPRYWDEVSELAPKLTKADQNGTLNQSTIALGSWDNIVHAKEILLSLLRGLGDPVLSIASGVPVITFGSATPGSVSPAESALRFYTEFADSTKSSYSWNRTMPSSGTAFVAGRLALYIGRASELYVIREANPNLNFDVAPLPAARGGGEASAVDLYILAIPRGAKNPNAALAAAQVLSGVDGQKSLTSALHVPSVRRELLTVSAGDPYSEIFRTAALSSFAFLDPDPVKTDAIFKRAVDSILSGRFKAGGAVGAAREELDALLGQ